MIAEKNKRMAVTIGKKTYDKLEKIAESEHRSVSNYVLSLIKKDLQEKTRKAE